MHNYRGLETIGTVYFIASCLLALEFLIAMFSLPEDMVWLMIGSTVGVVLQGFTAQAELGWMSDMAVEMAGMRSALRSLQPTAAPIPARKLECSPPSAAAGSAGTVEAWGCGSARLACGTCWPRSTPRARIVA